MDPLICSSSGGVWAMMVMVIQILLFPIMDANVSRIVIDAWGDGMMIENNQNFRVRPN